MKTEESIRIILSLYVTIEQNLYAMTFYKDFLAEEVLDSPNIPPRKEHSIDEAIMESLWLSNTAKFTQGFRELINSRRNGNLLVVKLKE